MKWMILMSLLLGAWFITKETETTVEIQSEEEITVSWLRDGQDGEKNSAVDIGSFFVTKRNTVYGADCIGCTIQNGIASTSSMIEVTTDSVRQSDGSWKKGITYDGYYLIAADDALPLCTVVQISEHSYTGEGLREGVPFYALVVDRGSMIDENVIDLFAGSEKNSLVSHQQMSGAVVEIVGFLNYQRNEIGQMSCAGN